MPCKLLRPDPDQTWKYYILQSRPQTDPITFCPDQNGLKHRIINPKSTSFRLHSTCEYILKWSNNILQHANQGLCSHQGKKFGENLFSERSLSTKLRESKGILVNYSVYHAKLYGENSQIVVKFHWENPNEFSHLVENFWPCLYTQFGNARHDVHLIPSFPVPPVKNTPTWTRPKF